MELYAKYILAFQAEAGWVWGVCWVDGGICKTRVLEPPPSLNPKASIQLCSRMIWTSHDDGSGYVVRHRHPDSQAVLFGSRPCSTDPAKSRRPLPSVFLVCVL